MLRRALVEVHDRPCSFCGDADRSVLLATPSGAARICEACLGFCGETFVEGQCAMDPHHALFADHVNDAVHALAPRAPTGPGPGPGPGPGMSACSFCGREEARCRRLVSEQRAAICDGCVGYAAREYERVLLRRRHGDLPAALLLLLFRHDPVGINYETNLDEYQPEVAPLLRGLPRCESVDDAVSLLHEVFVTMFDAKLAGPRARYEPIAAEVWELWRG